MTPRAEIIVDLSAIRANIEILRARAGDAETMVVLKADAYGHGMETVAATARDAGVPWIGVTTLEEALALRAAGDTGRLLCWIAVPGEDYAPAIEAGIDLTAYSEAELAEIVAAVDQVPARVQLKIDTGLSRGGAMPADWPGLVAAAAAAERAGTIVCTGVWSHLATADAPGHPAGAAQQDVFEEAARIAREAGLNPALHLANSAATMLRPEIRYDLVRVGIATYGLDPAPGLTDVALRPAMTLRTRLSMVKPLHRGDGVSYGHTFVADGDMEIGLVPLGYGDGILRSASGRGEVQIRGRRCPVLGRICMDQFVVDVSGIGAEAGDEVIVFGPGDDGEPTAQDWAEAAGTINYEIVTHLGGRRVTRSYAGA